MKRILILVTLALFLLCLVKGSSQGLETDSDSLAAVDELNQAVDARLETRVQMLALGTELSVAMADAN